MQRATRVAAPSDNKRVPPALTAFAPGHTARVASRVGTLERYLKAQERDESSRIRN